VRTERANGEPPETWDQDNPAHSWEWHDNLSATPDGFVIDALDSGFGRGLGFKGLLEIKCPASKHQINGVARRHNPDIRLHVEDDPYTLLQAFQQLLVCTEAKHIDIVYFKRTGIPNAQTGAVETHDYVWLARLYRHQGHMDAIRALIRDSIELFVQAMHATKRVEEDTETEDETTEQRDNRRERQAAAWAARVERNDDRLPQRDDRRQNTLPLGERKAILAALKAWTDECLRWRNGYEPQNGYPWRSVQELASRSMSFEGLCHRFHVNSGRAANHSGAPTQTVNSSSSTTELGYAPIVPPPVQGQPNLGRPLEARDIWGTEPIGMH